jgi:hypothetical protein
VAETAVADLAAVAAISNRQKRMAPEARETLFDRVLLFTP